MVESSARPPVPGRSTLDVETPGGPGRLVLDVPDAHRAVLLLGHGAGGGVETVDLDALAAALPPLGYAVARYEQPWRVAGRKVAGPPKTLDAGWAPAVAACAEAFPGVPLIVGGRSAGARVACRWAASGAEPVPAGVVALSFPLHPPGKPEKSRLPELAGVPCPVLLVSGEKDPFGSPAEFAAALATPQAGPRTFVGVPGSTHSFSARRAADGRPGAGEQVVAAVADAVAGWVSAPRPR